MVWFAETQTHFDLHGLTRHDECEARPRAASTHKKFCVREVEAFVLEHKAGSNPLRLYEAHSHQVGSCMQPEIAVGIRDLTFSGSSRHQKSQTKSCCHQIKRTVCCGSPRASLPRANRRKIYALRNNPLSQRQHRLITVVVITRVN